MIYRNRKPLNFVFLLYCGPFILKDILNENLLANFILFHVALRIVSCDTLVDSFLDEAELFFEGIVLFSRFFMDLKV